MQPLKELIDQLPPELQQEVQDFVEFLLEKELRRKRKKQRLTWTGAIKEYRDQFTSLVLNELAHPQRVAHIAFATCL